MTIASEALTVNEAAFLAGVSARRIEKAAEEGIVPKTKMRLRLRRNEAAHVPVHAVAYAATLTRIRGIRMETSAKKRIWKFLKHTQDEDLGVVRLSAGLSLTLNDVAGTEWIKALRYLRAREKHLSSDPEIFGGEPVITGTRITCRSVLGRVSGGETLDELAEDYPEIPREAFEAAEIYARTHPPRGRPESGKPWRKA